MVLLVGFKVGDNFPLEKVKEGIAITLYKQGIFLTIGFDNISNDEVLSFKKNKMSIDLTCVNDIIFMILEIKNIVNLSDAPFPICTNIDDFNLMASIAKEQYFINFFLIETNNNTIKAMRFIGAPPEFHKILSTLIEKQIEKNLTLETYKKNLNYVYNNFSSYNLKKMSMFHFEIKDKER